MKLQYKNGDINPETRRASKKMSAPGKVFDSKLAQALMKENKTLGNLPQLASMEKGTGTASWYIDVYSWEGPSFELHVYMDLPHQWFSPVKECDKKERSNHWLDSFILLVRPLKEFQKY